MQQTIAWMVIFFFASTAASSAYLTVSETFPLEVRALAIAFFYAIGTGIGGIAGPWLFGLLIDTGSRWSVFAGYLLGAVLMLVAAVVAARYARAGRAQAARSRQPAAGGGRLRHRRQPVARPCNGGRLACARQIQPRKRYIKRRPPRRS